jgi:hypothetical protein
MSAKSDAIRILNDHLHTTFTGGRALVTAAIAELNCERKTRVLLAVREVNDFGPDNDPHREHDLAFFDVDGERYLLKVDYYDLTETCHSPDPADSEQTHRVLTIGHHSEY